MWLASEGLFLFSTGKPLVTCSLLAEILLLTCASLLLKLPLVFFGCDLADLGFNLNLASPSPFLRNVLVVLGNFSLLSVFSWITKKKILQPKGGWDSIGLYVVHHIKEATRDKLSTVYVSNISEFY